MSKSPSYVSKSATYIGPDFLPTSGGSKSIAKTKQYYLLSDVKYSKDGKASKIKTVYEKSALVKSVQTAKTRGLEGARSMTGTAFKLRNLVPIGVSPNRLRKLFAKLGDMGCAFKGLKTQKILQKRAWTDTGSPIYKMSPGEKEKFPSHWGKYKWHLRNYGILWDMIKNGKIKTVQQLDDINIAFQTMDYGYKNPNKLIHKVLNGTIQREQVNYLYAIRAWIYGKESSSTKDKINRFLENKVLKGELTKEKVMKIKNGPENLTKFVSYIKSVFHKK
jgi:hypothetical protein